MVKILAQGNWNPRQVRVTWRHDSRLRHDAVDQLIEQTWAAAIARRGIKLFDGKMCRLESWAASAASLDLVLSPTTYNVFFGTNLTHPELADTYGSNVLANPVGLSAALVTADGFLMLGRRNAAVAYYPSRIHPFAGCLEPKDGDDLFAAIGRELAEELGFSRDDVAEMRCIGIVEDQKIRQPEVVFSVRSHRTRAEIEQRVDSGEHHGSWAVPLTDAELERGMDNPQLTPVAVGVLGLMARD